MLRVVWVKKDFYSLSLYENEMQFAAWQSREGGCWSFLLLRVFVKCTFLSRPGKTNFSPERKRERTITTMTTGSMHSKGKSSTFNWIMQLLIELRVLVKSSEFSELTVVQLNVYWFLKEIHQRRWSDDDNLSKQEVNHFQPSNVDTLKRTSYVIKCFILRFHLGSEKETWRKYLWPSTHLTKCLPLFV